MIDLFSVKLNGEYDEIGVTPTIENGLFLCDTTGEEYTRGYSYEITEGEAKRVDIVQDYKIEKAIIPTIQSVCNWLNNWFIPAHHYCGSNDFIPRCDEDFIKGILFPLDVEQAISQMIYFDIYTRGTVDGLKSESVGNYSYTLEDTTIGSLSYPSSLVSALELNYRKVRFVQ